MNRSATTMLVALGLLLAAGGAPAQAPAGGVPYRCGGVGQDEQQAMQTQAGGYDLKLTFATRRGAYLADVQVEIRDSRGQAVLQARCDAPIMLVDLPGAGRYDITATAQGQARHAAVAVDNGTASLTFTWNAP